MPTVLSDPRCLSEGAVLESQIVQANGVAVVAASRRLAAAERIMAGELGAEAILRRELAQAGLDDWHYILLDPPPAVGLLAINALAAAPEVLIPVEAHVRPPNTDVTTRSRRSCE